MFWSNFSFKRFSLMLFPLFSKVFTDMLKIYEPPKLYKKIPKYCQTLFLKIIIYQANAMNYTHISFIENVPKEAKKSFSTKLKKKSYVGSLFKMQCQKSPFLVASYVVPILYNKPYICSGD